MLRICLRTPKKLLGQASASSTIDASLVSSRKQRMETIEEFKLRVVINARILPASC
jgi:hypothetical protein